MQYSYGIHLLWEIYFILKIIFSWASGVRSTNQSNEIRQNFRHFKLFFGKLGWIGLKLFLNIRSSWVGLIIVIKMILPIYFYSFVFLQINNLKSFLSYLCLINRNKTPSFLPLLIAQPTALPHQPLIGTLSLSLGLSSTGSVLRSLFYLFYFSLFMILAWHIT